MANSFQALRRTFERRLAAMDEREAVLLSEAEEDAPDDETAEVLDADELERLAHASLRAELGRRCGRYCAGRGRSEAPDGVLS